MRKTKDVKIMVCYICRKSAKRMTRLPCGKCVCKSCKETNPRR